MLERAERRLPGAEGWEACSGGGRKYCNGRIHLRGNGEAIRGAATIIEDCKKYNIIYNMRADVLIMCRGTIAKLFDINSGWQ